MSVGEVVVVVDEEAVTCSFSSGKDESCFLSSDDEDDMVWESKIREERNRMRPASKF